MEEEWEWKRGVGEGKSEVGKTVEAIKMSV